MGGPARSVSYQSGSLSLSLCTMRMEAKVTDEPTARVAGAEVGQLHTLPASKWHEEVRRRGENAGGPIAFTQPPPSHHPSSPRHARPLSLSLSPPHHLTQPSGHHLRIDAMGAESPADLELLVAGGEVVVKCGSAARTHIALPPGADAGGVWGDLQAGALDIHVPAKKGG